MSVSQTKLIEHPELAEMLNNCSIDRVMAVNTNWEIIAWNATSEKITGLEKQAILGRPVTEVFPQIAEDEEMMTAIRRAFLGLKSFLPSAGERFNRHHIENHFIPLRDEHDELIGVMNIMHDVAHRVKAEKQLAKLNEELEKKYQQLEEANKSLAAFTYIAGREIQEPVRNIYTSLELIAHKEGHSLTPWSRGSLRKMQASLNRINLLLADLLAISEVSRDKEKKQPIDLNEIMNEVRVDMRTKLDSKNARLTVSALPAITGYHDMLKYLFHHLIENSIKFQPTDQAPVIEISINNIIADGNEFHQINFSDNGIGFDPAESTSVFEMFRRLHPGTFKGSGIGLSLCKKIMELHNGTISAHSEPGRGTIISCLFPKGAQQNPT